MLRLARRDLHAILDCLRMVYATLDFEAFPRQVVAALRRVVPAPFGSYNEIDHGAAQIKYVVEPAEAEVPHLELTVRKYLHEQPVLAHYARTGDGSSRRLSDFLTRSEFHRLSIYSENYCRTGVEFQIIFMIRSFQRPSSSTIAIALDRGRGDSDFTERDRLVLNLLRPHVLSAYTHAEIVSTLRRQAHMPCGAPEMRQREIIVLCRTRRPLVSPRGTYWLAKYFNDPTLRSNRLPDDLKRWIQIQATRLGLGKTLPAPAIPLILERENRRLSIRLIPDSPDDLLILEEERTTVDYAAFQQFGLTPREAEVLHWVAEGRTNREIGGILHASPRTVSKHLERILKKLSVQTRTAAAVHARLMPDTRHETSSPLP